MSKSYDLYPLIQFDCKCGAKISIPVVELLKETISCLNCGRSTFTIQDNLNKTIENIKNTFEK